MKITMKRKRIHDEGDDKDEDVSGVLVMTNVLAYTMNSQRQKMSFILLKLGWEGVFLRARPLCFTNQ